MAVTENGKIPQIDSPEAWAVGNDVYPELLQMYTYYPVKLKCDVIVLCLEGEVDAEINLSSIHATKNQLIRISGGSIMQLTKITGDVKVFYLAFSEDFTSSIRDTEHSFFKPMFMGNSYTAVTLNAKELLAVQSFFQTCIHLADALDKKGREAYADQVYGTFAFFIERLSNKNAVVAERALSRDAKISRDFNLLVMKNYTTCRNVDWYAAQLGFSHTHLSSVVRKVTGKTCTDLIANMVINDSKSRLKLTNQTIQQISDDLNFADMSFFCKYFKRYTGMTPLQWRNAQV